MPATRTVTTEFEWDSSVLRYRRRGQFVSDRAVKLAIRRVVAASTAEMRALSNQLADGTLSVGDWQTRFASELKNLHVSGAMAGKGGFAQMTPADYGRVGREIRFQYEKLAGFARDVKAGNLTRQQVLARTEMYVAGMHRTFEATRRGDAAAVFTEEKNVLGATDQHCAVCKGETRRGYVPVGSLIPIGQRTCMSRCLCRYVFRKRRQLA